MTFSRSFIYVSITHHECEVYSNLSFDENLAANIRAIKKVSYFLTIMDIRGLRSTFVGMSKEKAKKFNSVEKHSVPDSVGRRLLSLR